MFNPSVNPVKQYTDMPIREVPARHFEMRPLQWWAESAFPGGDRVNVSENLGATSVAPVAPVDTSLPHVERGSLEPFKKKDTVPNTQRQELSTRIKNYMKNKKKNKSRNKKQF